MIKVVPDSSVIVKWVSQQNELYLAQSDKLLTDVQHGKVKLYAPELSKYEIGNALLKKGLTEPQAFQSLETIYSLPIQFVSETEELACETYHLANEVKLKKSSPRLTYYDASFIALAKKEKAVLVTANPKHQTQASGVKVVTLGEYK